jgi:lon-related putative ATP-dependent protease
MTDCRLDPAELFSPCDPQTLDFETTEELPELQEVVGQTRALEALRFGVGIRQKGYNLYALGPTGAGKHSVVRRLIEQHAVDQPVPSDYCYVNNFEEIDKPRALELPAGTAIELRDDMDQLVEEFSSAVPAALESDEYRARRQEIEERLKERQEEEFQTLYKKAEGADIRLMRTPAGFAFAPMQSGQVIEPEKYQQLSAEQRAAIESRVAELQDDLDRVIQQMPRWRRDMQQEIKQLNREVVMGAVGQLMDEVRGKYEPLPQVVGYLEAVQADVIEHADQFRPPGETPPMFAGLVAPDGQKEMPFLSRYQVDVLVDHSGQHGAPVVYQDNPTFPNLVGRVEHQAQMGALITDFTMIKPGSLHEANGGYLILDARKVLMQPYAWEGLKRVLRSGEINIESLGQAFSLISTVSLDPEPIPLDIKVVLVGDRSIYYLLSELDDEFQELFKVAADFDDLMDRTGPAIQQYAALLATFARREKLRPLDAGSVARVIEHASRMVEDAAKLSARFSMLVDLIREADFWAADSNHAVITANDVQLAIDAGERRHSRVRERLLEATLRGDLMISTDGATPGQVNGLAVMSLGEHAFGHPNRITARVRLGKGELVDIEREVKLGGPIHSKGVLILAGYLAGRYCPGQTLSMHASLVFEQTYGHVEGDSASAAELFALLSALADAPVKQSLAVTGSINQHGQIQPIGGVNEKIEGFFDVCLARGLTGEQGVVIPRTNVKNLMLRKDVVEAAAAERFHVYAIETVDQGVALLTGCDAGERDAEGSYPADSLNGRVEASLTRMAEQVKAMTSSDAS